LPEILVFENLHTKKNRLLILLIFLKEKITHPTSVFLSITISGYPHRKLEELEILGFLNGI